MTNLILDERDQKFVLHEMLHIEELCETELFSGFSSDIFDMVLNEARKLALDEIFPTLTEGDRERCTLEDGQVCTPKAFHRVYKLFCEGGWNSMVVPQKYGGQGFPVTIRTAAHEWFMHNFGFYCYPGTTEGAAHLVESYGTDEQKRKYLKKMVAGQWGGTMILTEPSAGSDIGSLTTKAVRQPDGTFRIKGTKIFITSGDSDLVENIIHPVLARIEGDPPGTKGISIFLVPKYLVNHDGSLGRRNDYTISKIEEKMGMHGSSTCLMNFGDSGECYAELLGQERQGMKIMFLMMNEARLAVGMQGLSSASIAYLHALQYAKERLQGSSLLDLNNPGAPRVSIIQHPDVRRMLIWMKSHVEGMRALVYFIGYCFDMSRTESSEEEKGEWSGLVELLTPLCKAFCSDIGFDVCNMAMQVYGGYGYCTEYPIEQFMRDERISGIYEGTNGIQALDLVGRKLGMKKGLHFTNLLKRIRTTIAQYGQDKEIMSLGNDVLSAIDALADIGLFFSTCAREGKFFVPVCNAYPFLMMMGQTLCGWLLFWQAGIAKQKLGGLVRKMGVDPSDSARWSEFIKNDKDAAFYSGKITSAQYFIRNVLPEVQAMARAIKNEDMSIMEMSEESFASL